MAETSERFSFLTEEGILVPAITAEQMREVDRIAMEDFGLGILQMMENAGRNLAANVMEMLGSSGSEVTVLVGAGGNGGGGLCCARHLHNRGYRVNLVPDREPMRLRGAAANQLRILQAAGYQPVEPSRAEDAISRADVVIDALIGYSLHGAPRGRTGELIELCNQHAELVLALDVPSGVNATTGETPGTVVRPDQTLTLALPKTGLASISGEILVADIGIPPEAFRTLEVSFERFFGNRFWVSLQRGTPPEQDR